MSIKGTVSPSLSRDFRHFFGLKDLSWAPYEQAKTLQVPFAAFQQYLEEKMFFQSQVLWEAPVLTPRKLAVYTC